MSAEFPAVLPFALEQAVFERLGGQAGLGGRVHFFAAPVDTPLPYLEFWTGDGTPDEMGGFGEDAEEYSIYIQVSARRAVETAQLFSAADSGLRYRYLTVLGWEQRGKITWLHELDDPGDPTQDDNTIYYAGGCYRIGLFRQRTDI